MIDDIIKVCGNDNTQANIMICEFVGYMQNLYECNADYYVLHKIFSEEISKDFISFYLESKKKLLTLMRKDEYMYMPLKQIYISFDKAFLLAEKLKSFENNENSGKKSKEFNALINQSSKIVKNRLMVNLAILFQIVLDFYELDRTQDFKSYKSFVVKDSSVRSEKIEPTLKEKQPGLTLQPKRKIQTQQHKNTRKPEVLWIDKTKPPNYIDYNGNLITESQILAKLSLFDSFTKKAELTQLFDQISKTKTFWEIFKSENPETEIQDLTKLPFYKIDSKMRKTFPDFNSLFKEIPDNLFNKLFQSDSITEKITPSIQLINSKKQGGPGTFTYFYNSSQIFQIQNCNFLFNFPIGDLVTLEKSDNELYKGGMFMGVKDGDNCLCYNKSNKIFYKGQMRSDDYHGINISLFDDLYFQGSKLQGWNVGLCTYWDLDGKLLKICWNNSLCSFYEYKGWKNGIGGQIEVHEGKDALKGVCWKKGWWGNGKQRVVALGMRKSGFVVEFGSDGCIVAVKGERLEEGVGNWAFGFKV